MTTIKQIKAEAQAQIKAIREARDAAINELRQARQEKREPVLASSTETYEQRAERVLEEVEALVIDSFNRDAQREKITIMEAFSHVEGIESLLDEIVVSGCGLNTIIDAYCNEHGIEVTQEMIDAQWRVENLDVYESEYHADLAYRIHNINAEFIVENIEYEPMTERVARYHEEHMNAFWEQQEIIRMERLANE